MPKSYASVRNYEMDHKQFFERNEKFKLTFSWWISASVSGASPIKIMKLSHHDLNLKCKPVFNCLQDLMLIWNRYSQMCASRNAPDIVPTFLEIWISLYTQKITWTNFMTIYWRMQIGLKNVWAYSWSLTLVLNFFSYFDFNSIP